ncbi:G-protein coupled receptor Mth2-like [Venturia canescens]|uniref:G-protein coupled receptor Mth2-like n=1 Tax=Venturia canescens TaxID=32260 RepID=UPI001C9C4A61|nr:G-protein coupled receptor Mth2-like [Venturia canescens]
MVMLLHLKCILMFFVIKTASSTHSPSYRKCCDSESILNDWLECTKVLHNDVDNGTVPKGWLDVENETKTTHTVCLENGEAGRVVTEEDGRGNDSVCVDNLTNGTQIRLFCDSQSVVFNGTSGQCDSLFSLIHFWGASMVVFATIIYNIPFIIVVIIYCVLPELRYRAYDRAVSNYNACYMVINFLLIILGLCTLCHSPMSVTAYRFFGLSLMFWTQGAVCWLFIICFDMTLVITRFRWAPKGGLERGREEKRKCMLYAAWGWGFAGALTFIAAFFEFVPILSEDSIIRPNFHKIHEVNLTVVVYVMTGPALVCTAITCLFIYTTVKTIAVQRSTAVIQQNRNSNVKKKYFVFLKLYLLMDTPWLTSALAAVYGDLWILKFIKIIQPILIIVLIVPRDRIFAAFKCTKEQGDNQEQNQLNENDKINKRSTKTPDAAAVI